MVGSQRAGDVAEFIAAPPRDRIAIGPSAELSPTADGNTPRGELVRAGDPGGKKLGEYLGE